MPGHGHSFLQLCGDLQGSPALQALPKNLLTERKTPHWPAAPPTPCRVPSSL